jgi:hypothetical protein
MADKIAQYQVRIMVKSADPEKESEVAKAIATEFLKMGVRKLTVIAGDQHLNYVDNEVYNATTGDLFTTHPKSPTDSFVIGHRSDSVN